MGDKKADKLQLNGKGEFCHVFHFVDRPFFSVIIKRYQSTWSLMSNKRMILTSVMGIKLLTLPLP